MTTDLAAWLINLIATYPWALWIYGGAVVLAVGLRRGWPDEVERPRWLRVFLGIVDCLQLNPSGPLKNVGRAADPNPPLTTRVP